MKINVTENKVSIKEEQILNENEYNIHKIQFDFSSEYTDDLVKVALFSIDNHTYKKIISNNECDIPPEILTQRGYSILGVYAYKTEQDTLVLRYSPSPTKISVYDGSYKADAENSEPITPSEIEQYQQILQNSLQQFQNQYNALVEETEGDIQAIEDELQRKVDEGYFDGEDGFSPIAKVIQKSNGATIEIEDKTGRTSASVFNGYSPQRGVDYWTQEDKEEVIEEATQQIEGKIEEYNENAAEKLNQYNQNSVQKTNDYNTNAEQKMSAYNTNATEKFDDYNSNAEQKEINYNTNASQKVESFNTNANSKLSEYNSNAETKKTAYDENATQKTNSFNTNATNKLTEYNTNHTEKMSAYNSNSIQKLNAFNENATQKTEDFDEHTEEIQESIENLQTENARLKATLPTTTGEGQAITLNKTAELEFVKPPLPMGNSEQVQYSGKNLVNTKITNWSYLGVSVTYDEATQILTINGTSTGNASLSFGNYNFSPISVSSGERLNLAVKYVSGSAISNDNGRILLADENYTLSMSIPLNGINTDKSEYKNVNANLNYNILQFGYRTGDVYNNLKIKIMICKGTDISYEPYVGGTASPNPDYPQEITNVTGDVEVVVENKNLFDASKMPNATDWKTFPNGKILYIKVKPNTQYVLSSNVPQSNNTLLYFNGTNTQANGVYNGKSVMQTSDDEGNLFVGFFTNRDYYNDVINGTYYIQLEKGSTPTDYVEHKQQTFTFPLGNEKLMLGDYLADDGIHHVRGQVILDENLYLSYASKPGQFFITNQAILQNYKNATQIYSNYFKYSVTPWGENCLGITSNNNFWMYIKDGPTTLTELRSWLSTHNVTVEYKLEEEVIVPYTSAQQEVYNQIKQALSYEEQTNISSNQNAIFNVEAYQSTKLILEEFATAIVALGGV